ncbi:MAG: linoleoyl-CoA desaturase [Candidatus Sumerlaeota bacterium]|nr:linoleoyl-CoA desaturase [Candidatus Sumerlaeota bacterium]
MSQVMASPSGGSVTRTKKSGASKSPRVRFEPTKGFQHELKSRVEEYFAATGKTPRGSTAIYRKAIVILAWLAGSYAALVFLPLPLWGSIAAALSLGLATAAVGFNIQHDGGHRAFSDNTLLNKASAFTLDIVGASSYIWNHKHNVLHHTYANIEGHDDDIDLGVLGRLSPHQKYLWFHRFQHVYLWFFYGFLTFKWFFVTDFVRAMSGKINTHSFPRPKGMDLFLFVLGKVIFFSLAFVIPALIYPLPIVIAFFMGIQFVQSVIISVVFQMAHTVEEAEFPIPEGTPPERIRNEWMIHQIETTVDFARNNKLLGWYIGGLNFQIEHHLFPRVSHVHYPALSRIVEETCAKYGVTYTAHPTLFHSLRSHYRWLRTLSHPTPA